MGFKVGNTEIIDSSGNIAATVGDIDGRDIAADGTKLDGIETSATADQTPAEILTAVKTVDGATSGLDADLLDGEEGSYYLDGNNFTNLPAGYSDSQVDTHLNTGTASADQVLSWTGSDYDWVAPPHSDTSSQASVNNSSNTVIQDITLDTYGHVTNINSKALSIPATSANNVGTYAWLIHLTSAKSWSVNSTHSGSSMRYSSVGSAAYNNKDGNVWKSASGTPSGTWRAMCAATTASSYEQAGLFIRIS